MSAIHPRLHKLLTLANAGVGGEREAAKRALEKHLAKAGLTLDDLERDRSEQQVVPVRFPASGGSPEGVVTRQIVAVLLGKAEFELRGGGLARSGRSGQWFRLTAEESVECRFLVGIHMRAFRRTLQDAAVAYIRANGLFPSDGATLDPAEMTREEIARQMRVLGMASSIDPTAVPQRDRLLGAGR